jgi:hypothetical protein
VKLDDSPGRTSPAYLDVIVRNGVARDLLVHDQRVRPVHAVPLTRAPKVHPIMANADQNRDSSMKAATAVTPHLS